MLQFCAAQVRSVSAEQSLSMKAFPNYTAGGGLTRVWTLRTLIYHRRVLNIFETGRGPSDLMARRFRLFFIFLGGQTASTKNVSFKKFDRRFLSNFFFVKK